MHACCMLYKSIQTDITSHSPKVHALEQGHRVDHHPSVWRLKRIRMVKAEERAGGGKDAGGAGARWRALLSRATRARQQVHLGFAGGVVPQALGQTSLAQHVLSHLHSDCKQGKG